MKNQKIISMVVVLTMFFCMGIAIQPVLAATPENDFIFDAQTGTITGYTGAGGVVDIPSVIGGVPVTTIGSDAFEDCRSITSITIPDSVTTIEPDAFKNCSIGVALSVIKAKLIRIRFRAATD
jgi:hypothetical protein